MKHRQIEYLVPPKGSMKFLTPSEVEEIAFAPLRDDQIQRGLYIDLDARPSASLDDDIQDYAGGVSTMIRAIRRLEKEVDRG
jgi:hypothetical protein